MNLVLTMAGNYQRFKDENINVPKYLLPWSDTTIIGEIIREFSKSYCWKSVVALTASSSHRWQPVTTSIINRINAKSIQVYGVKTDSQISTAKIALSRHYSMQGEKVLFANIDTILFKRDWQLISDMLDEVDGYVDVFKSESPNYSYVLPSDGIVSDIFEKTVVSDHASSGLYGFSDSAMLNKFIEINPKAQYFSEVISALIKSGSTIKYGELYEESETLVLGTPLEYFENLILHGSNFE